MTPEHCDVQVEFSRFSPNGLRARVTGTRSLECTIAYWQQLVERVARDHPKSLLVIDELRGTELTPEQWNDLVQSLVGKGLEQVRVAHVKLFGLDHVDYCELYANIAGFDARAFNTLGEAERWLRYGDTPDIKPPSFR